MSESITSRKNPRVLRAVRLRQRSHRRQQQRIIIDGCREIGRAWEAGVEIVELFVCPELVDAAGAALADRIVAGGAARLPVTEDVFARVAFGDRAEGLVAVAATPPRELASLEVPPQGLVAVLEGVEKPGNVGAVARCADAAGIDVLILAGGTSDWFNPNAIRSSAGTLFRLPGCVADPPDVAAWVRQSGLPLIATRVDATRDYTQVDWRRGGVILLGSEAEGLSDFWSGPDVTPVALPMLGQADSLNVACTAAVVFYEALRQRSA